MAGGYRCSLGHIWTPPDGSQATACPVCGDTTIVDVRTEKQPPVYVFASGGRPGGQDSTQSLALPLLAAAAARAPTREFKPPTPTGSATGTSGAPNPDAPDTPDPSFSSLVVVIPESDGPPKTSASSVVPFGHLEAVDFTPPLVPGYEILQEVGRGGMGVVYKARQLSLNRLVALKMILSGAHAGPTERDRFKREAEAVAALQHPHIVQIFEIGEANGHPYLALEFVEGGSLAVNLNGDPWDAKRAAGLIETLARTMQFAHDAGIVHRDLKPGNVLLAVGTASGGGKPDPPPVGPEVGAAPEKTGGASGFLHPPVSGSRREATGGSRPALAEIPKVTDFGLAKRLDETLGDGGTRTGAVMGTPSYIAPEQASGKAREVGPAVDVYALGAILYELLTGRPPFRGETPLDTVLQVLNDDPVPPKRLHPLVPRDLETICLKCLSKQPVARYAGAAALADDLRRFANGEPIHARPLSAWGRGLKWARRHPALAVLLAMTVTAAVSLVTVLSVAYTRVRDAVFEKEYEARVAAEERDRAEDQKGRAERFAAEIERQRVEAVKKADELKNESERTRRAAYALQLAQVAILCERDPRRAAALLEDEARCPPYLRDFTWSYLRRLCQRDDREYLDHAGDPLRAVAYSPTGTFVATAGDKGQVRVWDPRTGRTWAALVGHAGAVHGLAFSPDGTTIASAGADGTVRLWVLPVDILATARRTMTALPWLRPIINPLVIVPVLAPAVTLDNAHARGATCVVFRPDGRGLVSGGGDGFLRWWDLTGWRAAEPDMAVLGGAGAAAAALERATHSPDSRPVWVQKSLAAHTGGVLCLAYSQNGKLLVSGGKDRHPLVWAGDGSKLIQTLPEHGDSVRAVAITPDGGTIATANNPATDGQPPTVRVFNTQTWRDRRLFGHDRTIYALAISDDGRLLASAGFDKTVRLWDPDGGSERGLLVGHTQQVNALAFAPDRRTVVSAGSDGTAVVWQTAVRTHEPEDLLRNRDPGDKTSAQQVLAVGVGGRGTAFVVADDAARVRMFVADFVPPGRAAPPGPPGPLALTPIPFRPPPLKEKARAAAASTDGHHFVVAVSGGLLIWPPPGGPAPRPGTPRGAFTRWTVVKTPAPVHTVCIDPTDHWIATGDADGVRVYDLHAIPLATDRPLDLKGGERVTATPGVREVAFHPTRELLAVAVGTGVRIVTLQGKVLADVPRAHGPKATVEALAFDKAGETLATGDASGLIKLWALDPSGGLKFLRDLPGHTSAVYALAFSPDGRTLASGGDDRAVILWDPVAGQERLSLSGHADRVLRVAFNADGTALVTVGRDGAVKRWRADVRPSPESTPLFQMGLPGM